MTLTYRQMIIQTAQRLPNLRQRDIQEVLAVLIDLWNAELSTPEGRIHLSNLGRLYVETHTLQATGIVRERLLKKFGGATPIFIQRRIVRFRPCNALRMSMKGEPTDA